MITKFHSAKYPLFTSQAIVQYSLMYNKGAVLSICHQFAKVPDSSLAAQGPGPVWPKYGQGPAVCLWVRCEGPRENLEEFVANFDLSSRTQE